MIGPPDWPMLRVQLPNQPHRLQIRGAEMSAGTRLERIPGLSLTTVEMAGWAVQAYPSCRVPPRRRRVGSYADMRTRAHCVGGRGRCDAGCGEHRFPYVLLLDHG